MPTSHRSKAELEDENAALREALERMKVAADKRATNDLRIAFVTVFDKNLFFYNDPTVFI